MEESITLQLASILDSQAAAKLLSSILSLRGSNITLDGSEVRRLGGQCLQIILSAQRSWKTDGYNFAIAPASGELIAGFELFGISTELLSEIVLANES